MAIYKKCIPTKYYKSIFDIPYQELKEQGIKALFFDLDNTIIAYDEEQLLEKHIKLIDRLQNDFLIVIISNSGKKRVSKALSNTNYHYVYHAKKPLFFGFKKALKMVNLKKHEVLMIGDQLMTDVLGSNYFKIKVYLVGAVKISSDRKITKMNRKLENIFLKKVKRKEPTLYEERLKDYVKNN